MRFSQFSAIALTLLSILSLSGCSLFFSIPNSVRSFVATADKVELIADADKLNGEIKHRGDMIKDESLIATVVEAADKQKLIGAVAADAYGSGDAICFLPNHILRATKGQETVEIQICYGCMRYKIEGALGSFEGGLITKSSEPTLNAILLDKGIEQK